MNKKINQANLKESFTEDELRQIVHSYIVAMTKGRGLFRAVEREVYKDEQQEWIPLLRKCQRLFNIEPAWGEGNKVYDKFYKEKSNAAL